MNKKHLLYIIPTAIVIISVFIICVFSTNRTVFAAGKNYKIYYNNIGKERYYYEIWDNSEKIFVRDKISGLPKFDELDNDILEIQFGSGNAISCEYFDVQNKKISEEFPRPSAVKYGKVAYMKYIDDKLALIVQDIFDQDLYCKEFYYDFSIVAVPSNAMMSAQFINENRLIITYLTGDEYEVITTIIEL